MKYLSKLLIILSLWLYGTSLLAQNTIPASGGNSSGSGGTMSYSIGQVIYTKNSGSNGAISQGVQQPFEVSVIIGIEEAKDILLEFGVYPNPANDFVKLSIKNFEVQNLRYQLYDLNGSLLIEQNITGNETPILMQNYMPSIYFLRVIQGKKEIKSFKIIKH